MDLSSRLRLVKWSFRKMQLGIKPSDLVLDVGSGGNPHFRADVLLEKYADGFHRHGASAVADRPMVFSDACHMPFKDKAFDFVIAFHVLEHMRDPAAFLRELSRVAKAGYIETPNVVFERFVPYDVHLLEIMAINQRLYIRKKSQQAMDPFMEQLRLHQRDPSWTRMVYGAPELFHVRHFWQGSIDFEILNPDEQCQWFRDPEEQAPSITAELETGPGWRGRGLAALRKIQQLRRRKQLDLDSLLACPQCRGELLKRGSDYECEACSLSFAGGATPNFNLEAQLRD